MEKKNVRFKVGDIVTGSRSKVNCILDNGKAEIIKINTVGLITIKVLEKNDSEFNVGEADSGWDAEWLKLVETPREFKVGDKVKLPKTKSAGDPISSSGAIRRARENRQDYLYVVVKSDRNGRYVLREELSENSGDYFLLKDLELYEETPLKQADSFLKINVLYKGRQTIAEDENGNVGTSWCHSEEMDTYSKVEGSRIAIARLFGEDPFPKTIAGEEITVTAAEPKEEEFNIGDYVAYKNEGDRYDICQINSIQGTSLWGNFRDGFNEIPKSLNALESRELRNIEQVISMRDVTKVVFPKEYKVKEPKKIVDIGFKVGDYIMWKTYGGTFQATKIEEIKRDELWGYWAEDLKELPKTLKEFELIKKEDSMGYLRVKNAIELAFQPEEVKSVEPKYKVGQVVRGLVAKDIVKDGGTVRKNFSGGLIYTEENGVLYNISDTGLKNKSSGYDTNFNGYDFVILSLSKEVPVIIKTLKNFTSEEILEELKSRLQ